jgi:hypothetical protein
VKCTRLTGQSQNEEDLADVLHISLIKIIVGRQIRMPWCDGYPDVDVRSGAGQQGGGADLPPASLKRAEAGPAWAGVSL